jgi:hypothetical protein
MNWDTRMFMAKGERFAQCKRSRRVVILNIWIVQSVDVDGKLILVDTFSSSREFRIKMNRACSSEANSLQQELYGLGFFLAAALHQERSAQSKCKRWEIVSHGSHLVASCFRFHASFPHGHATHEPNPNLLLLQKVIPALINILHRSRLP